MLGFRFVHLISLDGLFTSATEAGLWRNGHLGACAVPAKSRYHDCYFIPGVWREVWGGIVHQRTVKKKNKVSQFYSWHENLLQMIPDKQPVLSWIFGHVFTRQSGLSDLMLGRCYFIRRQWKHCLVGQQGQKGEGL